MIEVIWHGRGGQGAFTASRLLGAAYSSHQDHHALAFPSFGPERRGAPMRAFTKLSDAKIGDRSTPERADIVVYLDDTLFDPSTYGSELKEGGRVLVNTTASLDADAVHTIDASGISRAILGRVIPNTVLLAALTFFIDGFEKTDLIEAIRGYMPARLHEKNIAVVEEVCTTYDPTIEGVGGHRDHTLD